MSIWYRAALDNNLKTVFSGDGGLFTAGRWNHQGDKVIYCSESIALCTLEWLSHHGLSISGIDYHRFSIEIPDNLVKIITLNTLFEGWDKTPATDVNRDFANEHLFSQTKFLGLALPSVMVPEELNLIINPLHDKFDNVLNSVKYLGQQTTPERKK